MSEWGVRCAFRSHPPIDFVQKWEVYVDQSKAALDRGAGATMDAFWGLAPANQVKVIPAVILKTKAKGPAVRCVSASSSFDVGNIDSVDKVFRILNKHMLVKVISSVATEEDGFSLLRFINNVFIPLLCQGVSMKKCDCLKWKYKGNGYLEAGKVAHAIDAYDKALATGVADQEGIILMMRANAYLQRAASHREKLKDIVKHLTGMVPNTETLHTMYEEAAREPALAKSIFRRVLQDTTNQETKFRQTQYRHGLYQYALLQAAQDSLRATQLLPKYADAWRRAGDILSELWKLKESAQYYVRAIELDNSLSELLLPVIKRLNKRQELLDNARAYGWSEDTLRLALDVAR